MEGHESTPGSRLGGGCGLILVFKFLCGSIHVSTAFLKGWEEAFVGVLGAWVWRFLLILITVITITGKGWLVGVGGRRLVFLLAFDRLMMRRILKESFPRNFCALLVSFENPT